MSFGIDDSGRSDVLECNDQGKVRAVRKLEQSDSVGESRYAVLHIMMHSTARSLMCLVARRNDGKYECWVKLLWQTRGFK